MSLVWPHPGRPKSEFCVKNFLIFPKKRTVLFPLVESFVPPANSGIYSYFVARRKLYVAKIAIEWLRGLVVSYPGVLLIMVLVALRQI